MFILKDDGTVILLAAPLSIPHHVAFLDWGSEVGHRLEVTVWGMGPLKPMSWVLLMSTNIINVCIMRCNKKKYSSIWQIFFLFDWYYSMELEFLQFQQHHEFCRSPVAGVFFGPSQFTMGFHHPDGRISVGVASIDSIDHGGNRQVFSIVAGILLMGNVDFKEVDNTTPTRLYSFFSSLCQRWFHHHHHHHHQQWWNHKSAEG